MGETDFWNRDDQAERSGQGRHPVRIGRELTRDEVYAPEVYGDGFMGRLNRDSAYMRYLVIRRTGWVGKAVAIIAVLALLYFLAGGAIAELLSW